MATVKITALPAITGAVADSTDVIPIVDVSSDVTSKITREEFFNNVPSITNIDGSVSVPSYSFTSDINTGMYRVGSDNLGFSVGGVEQLRLNGGFARLLGVTTETRAIEIGVGRTGDGNSIIDLIGDATYTDYGTRFGRNAGASGSSYITHRGTGAFQLTAQEAAPIAFFTTNIERARITDAGQFLVGRTAYTGSDNTPSFQVAANGEIYVSAVSGSQFNRLTTDGAAIQFRRQNTAVGNISVTASATAYNTSSDHRLKENVTPVANAADRVLALKPCRFNFISDPSNPVDGFLAHEAQAVVPNAVVGQKDEVDADGVPVYQSIDHSKMVPLLTAALQEALTKIADLEARLDIAGL